MNRVKVACFPKPYPEVVHVFWMVGGIPRQWTGAPLQSCWCTGSDEDSSNPQNRPVANLFGANSTVHQHLPLPCFALESHKFPVRSIPWSVGYPR